MEALIPTKSVAELAACAVAGRWNVMSLAERDGTFSHNVLVVEPDGQFHLLDCRVGNGHQVVPTLERLASAGLPAELVHFIIECTRVARAEASAFGLRGHA